MTSASTRPTIHYPVDEAWLAGTGEEIIDPGRPIVDPHHHLWEQTPRYLFDELRRDLGAGHNIRATVYIQCRSMYRADGDPDMAPVGETEFVNGIAAMSASGTYGPLRACAGIVGFADLRLGAKVDAVLEAHLRAAGDRFKGIRNSSVWDADETIVTTPFRPMKGLLGDVLFREGVARLEKYGLSLDVWLYFPQIVELADLARAYPGTTIVLDHVGAPLGVGVYAGRRQDVFAVWRDAIRDLARCPNVNVKLGGLGMRVMGFRFEEGRLPPTSAELEAAWRPYFETCIDAFGVDRCMFESNFPVDRQSCSYAVLWNAFKRFAAGCSEAEKHALFVRTACRVYRIEVAAGGVD